jgi:hypothetical protein
VPAPQTEQLMHLVRAREEAMGQLAANDLARSKYSRDIIPSPASSFKPERPNANVGAIERQKLMNETRVVGAVLSRMFPWMYQKPADEKGRTKVAERQVQQAKAADSTVKEVKKSNSLLSRLITGWMSGIVLWAILKEPLTKLWDKYKDDIGGLWDDFLKTKLGGWLKKKWDNFLKWVTDWWEEAAPEWLKEIWGWLEQKLSWLKNLPDKLRTLWEEIKAWITGVKDWFLSFFNALKVWFGNILLGIAKLFDTLSATIYNLFVKYIELPRLEAAVLAADPGSDERKELEEARDKMKDEIEGGGYETSILQDIINNWFGRPEGSGPLPVPPIKPVPLSYNPETGGGNPWTPWSTPGGKGPIVFVNNTGGDPAGGMGGPAGRPGAPGIGGAGADGDPGGIATAIASATAGQSTRAIPSGTLIAGGKSRTDVILDTQTGLLVQIEHNTRASATGAGKQVTVAPGQKSSSSGGGGDSSSVIASNIPTQGPPKLDSRGGYVNSTYSINANSLVT